MKVFLNGNYLAGDPADPMKTQASGLRVNGDRVVQESPRVEATGMKVRGKKNLKHTITFNVTRTHASQEAAELFILDHPEAMPDSGTWTFETNGVATREIIAALKSVVCTQTGITTRHAYTLIGGLITTPSP